MFQGSLTHLPQLQPLPFFGFLKRFLAFTWCRAQAFLDAGVIEPLAGEECMLFEKVWDKSPRELPRCFMKAEAQDTSTSRPVSAHCCLYNRLY